jgi:hypothetical protein
MVVIVGGDTYVQMAEKKTLSLSLSCCPNLEHRASVKRFVLLQFLNPKTIGTAFWTGDQPSVEWPLPIKTQTNTHALSGIRTPDPRLGSGKDIFMP